MGSRGWMLRLAALMGLGSLAVHQLRYLVGYHFDDGAALAAQGHGYLAPAGPVLAGVLVLALAELITRVAGGRGAPAPPFRRLWPAATGALVAVYVAQEVLEGALAPGHPGGLAGVAGHGGWVALPLAALIGCAIALLMRAASRVAEATAAATATRPWRATAPLQAPRLSATVTFLQARPGAPLPLAARGPPAASV